MIRGFGSWTLPDDDARTDEEPERFACRCGRTFSTVQGLGLHFKHSKRRGTHEAVDPKSEPTEAP